MVPDPYQALNLPHTATDDEIKRSYRELARKYHPDRYVTSSPEEREQATAQFATIASAYAMLSDPQKKAHYDHVYKYGGYDDTEERPTRIRSSRNATSEQSSSSSRPAMSSSSSSSRKRKSTGIGYTCVDPLAFLWTNGRIQSKMAVAGVQIPSRLHHHNPMNYHHPTSGGGGFRFAFSSAHLTTSPSGTKVWKSQTTTYSNGQKFTTVETTTLHSDGRTETKIDHNPDNNDDSSKEEAEAAARTKTQSHRAHGSIFATPFSENASSSSTSHRTTTASPWYAHAAHAWSGIKDKLMMCYSPCTVTAVQ